MEGNRNYSPTQITVSLKEGEHSVIMVEQSYAVGKDLLEEVVGTLEWYIMDYIDLCIKRLYFGSERNTQKMFEAEKISMQKSFEAEKISMQKSFEAELARSMETYKAQCREELRKEFVQELLSEQAKYTEKRIRSYWCKLEHQT